MFGSSPINAYSFEELCSSPTLNWSHTTQNCSDIARERQRASARERQTATCGLGSEAAGTGSSVRRVELCQRSGEACTKPVFARGYRLSERDLLCQQTLYKS